MSNTNITNSKKQEKNKLSETRGKSKRRCKKNLREWSAGALECILSAREFQEFIDGLSKRQLQLLRLMFSFGVDDRVLYMSQTTIAKHIGCTREWVNKTLKLFKQVGVCDWFRRTNMSSIYRLAPVLYTRDYLQILTPHISSLKMVYLGIISVASLLIPASFLEAQDAKYRSTIHFSIRCNILPHYFRELSADFEVTDPYAAKSCNEAYIDIPPTHKKNDESLFDEIWKSMHAYKRPLVGPLSLYEPKVITPDQERAQLEKDIQTYRRQLKDPDTHFAHIPVGGIISRAFVVEQTRKHLAAAEQQLILLEE